MIKNEFCVYYFQIAGDTSWLDVSLDNFGSACFREAEKIENLTKTNTTDGNGASVNIFTIIAETTCPKNCSGQGRCENGKYKILIVSGYPILDCPLSFS